MIAPFLNQSMAKDGTHCTISIDDWQFKLYLVAIIQCIIGQFDQLDIQNIIKAVILFSGFEHIYIFMGFMCQG